MAAPTIESAVAQLLAPGKGILAADESLGTIGKRFASLGIASTAESRLAYRTALFTAAGLGEFISGVILFDETIGQRIGGSSVAGALTAMAIIPGIKVDKGTEALPGFPGEKFTVGLEGLRERLASYHDLGARFTKWRAVVAVGDHMPSPACVSANARALAIFAALSQEAGLVPIVEPEVLMDGGHTIARAEEVTAATLKSVFGALHEQRVVLEHMLLKTGMVLPGKDCPGQVDPTEVAQATLRCLRLVVPPAVPGIVFLSGGQESVVATERLNAICAAGGPWKLSFSFGRALQDPAMKAWMGRPPKVRAAQAALLHRARCNALAVQGKYTQAAETHA
jgi:fructose-bisphosphate aldolase class I